MYRTLYYRNGGYDMNFYGREQELSFLKKNWEMVQQKARMVVITGRRRVGKTLLSQVYVKDKPHLYLFVAKKSEILLCEEFVNQIKNTFNIPIIGRITSFRDVFTFLLEIGKKMPFVLIIDEIQEFLHINPSVFSDIQELWDRYLFESKIQLLIMGSVYSLMHKIFQDAHEPLFGRADRILHLKPFSPTQLYEIMQQQSKSKSLEALFTYYLVTGGVPKYIELLLSEQAFSEKEVFDCVFCENSPFLEEGKNILIEEFGKEYGMYFSILELIAMGKTGRGEMESILQKDLGGYIERLESYYSLIEKVRPIHAKPRSKMVKYYIKDLFLKFWFRFIYRQWSAIETGNFDYAKEVMYQNLSTYKGTTLEFFFKNLFAEQKQFNRIGSYWDHDAQNEIDLVAINDLKKRIVICEIKTNKERIRMAALKQKAEKLLSHYPGYHPEYLALSLEDAPKFLLTSSGSLQVREC